MKYVRAQSTFFVQNMYWLIDYPSVQRQFQLTLHSRKTTQKTWDTKLSCCNTLGKPCVKILSLNFLSKASFNSKAFRLFQYCCLANSHPKHTLSIVELIVCSVLSVIMPAKTVSNSISKDQFSDTSSFRWGIYEVPWEIVSVPPAFADSRGTVFGPPGVWKRFSVIVWGSGGSFNTVG